VWSASAATLIQIQGRRRFRVVRARWVGAQLRQGLPGAGSELSGRSTVAATGHPRPDGESPSPGYWLASTLEVLHVQTAPSAMRRGGPAFTPRRSGGSPRRCSSATPRRWQGVPERCMQAAPAGGGRTGSTIGHAWPRRGHTDMARAVGNLATGRAGSCDSGTFGTECGSRAFRL